MQLSMSGMSNIHSLFHELRYSLEIQVALMGAVPVQVHRADRKGCLVRERMMSTEHMARDE